MRLIKGFKIEARVELALGLSLIRIMHFFPTKITWYAETVFSLLREVVNPKQVCVYVFLQCLTVHENVFWS